MLKVKMRESWSSPPPREAYFDAAEDAWVLSRHADVSAAFREPALRLAGPRAKEVSGPFEEEADSRTRTQVAAAMPPVRLAQWQSQLHAIAAEIIEGLPKEGPVDAVGGFARPWGLAAALLVTGADPSHTETLERLARAISLATADPCDEELQRESTAASAELERSIPASGLPMAVAAFVSLSETLPCFLANAWLALLDHPVELARLRRQPALMPRAIDELHRYCGLAQTLYRVATADVEVRGVRIAKGERVHLLVASANHDPKVFPSPERLDLARVESGQLALGAGLHACVGGPLIRMLAATATSWFVTRFGTCRLRDEPIWSGGTGFRWPRALWMI